MGESFIIHNMSEDKTDGLVTSAMWSNNGLIDIYCYLEKNDTIDIGLNFTARLYIRESSTFNPDNYYMSGCFNVGCLFMFNRVWLPDIVGTIYSGKFYSDSNPANYYGIDFRISETETTDGTVYSFQTRLNKRPNDTDIRVDHLYFLSFTPRSGIYD